MPTYVMQACELLRGICDEVVKLYRNFIWGDEDNHRKSHLLNWDKMCLPKKDGGLGQLCFPPKWLWDLYSNPHSLWGSLILHKYKHGRYGLPKVDPNKQGSNFSKSLGHE